MPRGLSCVSIIVHASFLFSPVLMLFCPPASYEHAPIGRVCSPHVFVALAFVHCHFLSRPFLRDCESCCGIFVSFFWVLPSCTFISALKPNFLSAITFSHDCILCLLLKSTLKFACCPYRTDSAQFHHFSAQRFIRFQPILCFLSTGSPSWLLSQFLSLLFYLVD